MVNHLVVLVGLPGSGKSSIGIINFVSQNLLKIFLLFLIFFKFFKKEFLKNYPEKSLAKKWSETDNFDYYELDSSFDENYKNEKSIRNEIGEKVVESLAKRNVLVDDTNHLKSMRHFWFSIAARAWDLIYFFKTEMKPKFSNFLLSKVYLRFKIGYRKSINISFQLWKCCISSESYILFKKISLINGQIPFAFSHG